MRPLRWPAHCPSTMSEVTTTKLPTRLGARQLLSSKILLCVLVAVVSAIVACTSFATSGALQSSSSPHSILIGPAHLKGGLVQLERHAGNATARLRIVTHTVWTDYRDLDQMLTIFKKSLARKQPFLLIWDVRSLTFPRVKMQQVQQVREFIKAYCEPFDTCVGSGLDPFDLLCASTSPCLRLCHRPCRSPRGPRRASAGTSRRTSSSFPTPSSAPSPASC